MYGLNQKGIPCEREYEISDEPILATLFTTGNGYMGVRGSFEEYASQRVQGAFVRGYIDEIVEVCEPFADNEYMKKYYLDEEGLKRFERQESCVNMPDFLMVRVTIGQKTFFPWEGKVEKWERRLDPRTVLINKTPHQRFIAPNRHHGQHLSFTDLQAIMPCFRALPESDHAYSLYEYLFFHDRPRK